MNTKKFEDIIESQFAMCRMIMIDRAKQYATDDRLHNFKVAAELQCTDPKNALAGMMAKHTVSVYDMCKSQETFTLERWDEKITDHINYLLLLKALVEEQSVPGATISMRSVADVFSAQWSSFDEEQEVDTQQSEVQSLGPVVHDTKGHVVLTGKAAQDWIDIQKKGITNAVQ